MVDTKTLVNLIKEKFVAASKYIDDTLGTNTLEAILSLEPNLGSLSPADLSELITYIKENDGRLKETISRLNQLHTKTSSEAEEATVDADKIRANAHSEYEKGLVDLKVKLQSEIDKAKLEDETAQELCEKAEQFARILKALGEE